MHQHLPPMGELTRPYSQIGLAGSSILSGCHHSDVSPAVFPLAFTGNNLYQVSPLELIVAPGGVVRWQHQHIDPYAASLDPNNASSTLMTSWIDPVPYANGLEWYYHARFRGYGHDDQYMVAVLAGIIAVSHDDAASQPIDPDVLATETFQTMVQWEQDPVFPCNTSALHTFNAALEDNGPADDTLFGHIGVWRVPYTTDTGTRWNYRCRFHDATGSRSIVCIRIEGVMVVEYLTPMTRAATRLKDRLPVH